MPASRGMMGNGRSVNRALVLGAALVVGLVLALALGLLWAVRHISEREAEIRDAYLPRLGLAERVFSAMVSQETGVRGYLITGDERFLEPFETGRAEYLTARDELLGMPALSAEGGKLREQQFELAEQWYSEVATPQVQARAQGTQPAGDLLDELERGKEVLDRFRAANSDYETELQRAIDAGVDDLRTTRQRIFAFGGLAALAVVALTVGIAVWLVRAIRRPMDALTGVVAAVQAGDGERRAPGLAAREFDHLGRGINGMLDAVEARAREAALEHGQLAAIVGSTSEGIVVVDTHGLVTLFNPAAEQLLGVPVARAIGAPAEALGFVTQAEWSTAIGGQPLVRRRGERVLSALVSPLVARDAAGTGNGAVTGGYVWVLRDVTELARVDEMKNEFISIVSHELRTPLTSIKGFTDLILEGDAGEVSDEQREYLEIVQTNSDRLVALINDMLDISRIESGRINLDLEEIDIDEAVERVVTSFRPLLAEKGLTFQKEIAEGAETVVADEARLQQVLGNLISNACKYTLPGGWITVRATPLGGQVAVSVSDTGMGIPAEALPRIFSKFYRANQPAARDVSGTGLGLAITKSLVELHGGKVSIASRPQVGTTVRFTLPMPRAARNIGPYMTEMDGSAPLPMSSGRVLLAEDDPDLANWLHRALVARGFDVAVVGDGLAAVVRGIETLPDAIILDVNMPKMGAHEAIVQLKGNPGTRDIPVIVLTGTVPDARPVFMDAGAAGFFTKPVDIDALVARLRQVTGDGR